MAYSSYLFLGYSLRDWNLRVILNRIWGQQELDVRSWAVQRSGGTRFDEIEQELWSRRGKVQLLYCELDEYVAGLAAELFGSESHDVAA